MTERKEKERKKNCEEYKRQKERKREKRLINKIKKGLKEICKGK